MQYALGSDDKTAPTSGWSEAIPTETKAGTYYVWYRVIGDANHTNSKPACVTVTIAEKPEKESETEENTETGKTTETEAPTVSAPPKTEKPDPKKEEATPAQLQTDVSFLLNSDFQVYWKGGVVNVKWGAAPQADTFDIYAEYCGPKECVKLRTVRGVNSVSLPELKGQKAIVKAYVVALKNGVEIGRTVVGHSAGSKSRRTNVKKISVRKPSVTLDAGSGTKIKVKTTKAKKNKKLVGTGHCAKVRYISSDAGVASVSSDGRITAVGAGSCDILVLAQNGRSCKVKVTVR